MAWNSGRRPALETREREAYERSQRIRTWPWDRWAKDDDSEKDCIYVGEGAASENVSTSGE